MMESGEVDEATNRYMLGLALNHSIIIDQMSGEFNAASPDELALVNFAKQMGYEYKSKEGPKVVISVFGKPKEFVLLATCEFTSTRKRASCIYKTPEGEILLLTKGADSVIYELLSEDSKASDEYTFA